MDTTTRAEALLDALRERAYRTIDNDPQVLLSGPGGNSGVQADAVFARLIGFDDQIDEDWRIPAEVHELLRAIPQSLPYIADGLTSVTGPSIRTARYGLWSGHAALKIDAMHADQLGIPWDFKTCQATLLFLRYKRTP